MSTSSGVSESSATEPTSLQGTLSPPFSPNDEMKERPARDLNREGINQNQQRPSAGVTFQRLGVPAIGNNNASKPPSLASKITQAVLLTPLHPVRFVHVLIQLGHEPVPPERRYSFLFQRYMYYWPGIIGYARDVVQKDGFLELYRGVSGNLACEITNIIAGSLLNPLVKQLVGAIPLSVVPSNGDVPDNEDNIETTRAVFVRGVRLFFHQLILKSAVTVIIQPFYTITIRMIAQHVGKETIYNSVWGSLGEIYHREGVAGFYKGLFPALLGGVLSTVMHVTLWVGLELLAIQMTQDVGRTVVRNLVRPFLISYVPRSYAYPFELMRAVISVNGSGLRLGMEPHVPLFSGWRNSYSYLKSQHVMYRGSVFFLPRYAYTNTP